MNHSTLASNKTIVTCSRLAVNTHKKDKKYQIDRPCAETLLCRNWIWDLCLTLLHPHWLYGLKVWRFTYPTYLKMLCALQNKAVKLISVGSYRDHVTLRSAMDHNKKINYKITSISTIHFLLALTIHSALSW